MKLLLKIILASLLELAIFVGVAIHIAMQITDMGFFELLKKLF